MAPGGSPAPFTIVVKDGSGGNVQGAVARLVDADGNVITLAPTGANGTQTSNALTGDYCVTVRLAPPSALAEPIIVPAAIPAGLAAELPLRTDVAPVVVTKTGFASWTASGLVNCLNTTPTKHNGSGTTIHVVLPASARLQMNLVGPDGQSLFDQHPNLTEVVGYFVSAVNTASKRPGNVSFDPDLEDGFLQFVSRSARPVSGPADPLLFGLAPNQSGNVEVQHSTVASGRTLNYTATLPFTAGAGGTLTVLQEQLFAEPLFCNQQFATFPQLDEIQSVNVGFMADPRVIANNLDLTRVLLPNLTVSPMELVVSLGEEYTVTYREDQAGGSRLTSDITFLCSATSCQTTGQKTSGGSGHIIFAFYRTIDANTAKATLFLTGLAANSARLTYSVKAKGTGEAIPIPSKKNAFAAETLINKPAGTSCPVQDSNDDKFFMGIA
jgi:hypothetical protein